MDLVSDVVKRNRLRWLGHVLRNDDGDWVKKSMSYEVEGVRGRHKRAWFEKGGCPGARQVEETAVGSRRGENGHKTIVVVYTFVSSTETVS